MRHNLSWKTFAITVSVTCVALLSTTVSAIAAYKPISLNLPSQLPLVTQGKSYNYSLASRVSGGTGRPYIWNLTGALPTRLGFNSSAGIIVGAVISPASVGTYPLTICVSGGKKGSIAKIPNRICKSTKLVVIAATTSTVNNASGIYSGNVNWPDVSVTTISNTCGAQVMNRTITLQEGAGGAITGSADNGTQISGTRVGSTITVTLQTSHWGARGPFIWQWSATTLSGTLVAICYNLSTFELLREGTYAFTLSKSQNATTPASTPTPTPTSTPSATTSSGTYAGYIDFPNLNSDGSWTGCVAASIYRTVTLVEGANGAITGTTNHEKMQTLTGSRSGNSITVTLQSVWGARGPYVWQLNGSTLTGTLPAFCWDLNTGAKLNEGSYNFTLQRS